MSEVRAAALHVQAAGSGAPLVLLHGWALHGGLFLPLLPALAASHRVHAVDLPGHGYSEALRPWSIERCVDALEAAFGAGTVPLTVLGWSLGGIVAMAWALRHPERIGKLVLVSTTPKFVADTDWPHAMSARTLGQFADELRVSYRLTLQRFLALQVQGSDAGKATLATMRQQLFERGEPDAAVLDEALEALCTVDLRSRAMRIGQPALVVAGDRDTLVPVGASAWLARTLPAARSSVIAGAAHAPFLSHPKAFMSALDAFLDDG